MQQIVVCKLDTRRRDSQQIEKELLAMSVRERCLEPGYPGAVLDFDNVVVNRCGIDTTVLDGFQRSGVRQDVGSNGLVAPDQALAGEVLLKLQRLGGKGLRDAADAAVMQWSESAEIQLAFIKIALPDALILYCKQQAFVFGKAQFSQQRRCEQR